MSPERRVPWGAPGGSRRLVGRDAELAVLADALAATASGVAGTLLVVGEAGIGKTSLVRAATSRSSEDLVVLDAVCGEAEQELEYGVVQQLLAATAGHGVPRPDPAAEAFQVGAGLLDVLGRLQEAGATVCVLVDDVQWADDRSLEALAFTTRRLRADRVLLCLVSRPDGVARLPEGLTRWAEESHGRVEVTGLHGRDVVALATRDYGLALRPGAGERLRSHTGGNPLHLRALLDRLPGAVLDGPGPLPVPASYAALVSAQADGCSPEARELLSALAVLGPEADLHVVAAVAGITDPLEASEELADAGLADLGFTEAGTRLAFRHALVRESVLDTLRPARRVRLHAAAAGILEGHEALRHRLAASSAPNADLLQEAREQAEVLVESGAPTPGARLLTAAARLLSPGPEREELVLRAATLLLDSGAPLGSLAEEVPTYAPGPGRDFVLGRMAFQRGEVLAAAELLGRAWSTSPEGSPLTAPVADMLAIVSTGLGRYDDLAMWSRRAVGSGSASLNSPVMLLYGVALASSLGAAEQELAALAREGPREEVRLGARLAHGMALLAGNHLEAAETELTAAGLAPRVQGSVQALVNARAFLAECHFRQGRWSLAHDLAAATASLVDDAGARWMAALPHAVAATVLAAQGERAAAGRHAEEAQTTADELGMTQAFLWAGVASLRIAEAAEDHAGVVRAGDRLVALGTDQLPDWVQRRRPAYVESLAAVGRLDDGAAELALLDAEVTANGDTALAAEAARARAAWCLATGDRAGALAALERGLALDERLSRPFERARLELAVGALRRRAGERRSATRHLQAAATRLRSLGARPWLERCERELAACGLQPVRRDDPGARLDLTPQERLVAHLATTGRTNREIAAELVLSVKTIEFHLGRIYRKLGVRSRTELAALTVAEPTR